MIAEEPRHEMLTAERIEVLPSFGAPPKTSDLSEDQEISPSTSPLVSVVVPVARSVPSTIRRCLSSLAKQDYTNKEIVIVDSSFDPTLRRIAESYSARIITSSLSKAQARNLGVQMSLGNIILHVDADMLLSERVLSNCVTLIGQGFDAIVIPESVIGPGFLHECRRLEKDAYTGSHALEAVRCVTKKIHYDVGGFDEHMGSIDEFPYHSKILKAGAKIGRSKASIFVSEPILNLDKRFDQGRDVQAYRSKYANRFRLQFSLLGRTRLYTKIVRKKPFHFATLVILKSLELGALFAGLARPHWKWHSGTIDRKNIASHFDGIAKTYEHKFGRTLGGKLADDEEKTLLEASIRQRFGHSPSNASAPPIALDLGSGPGRLTPILLKTNAYTITIDISHQMCRACKERFKDAQLDALRADMSYLPLRSETVTLMMSFRSAKYVTELDPLLCEARRVLDHNGLLFLEMPNALSPFYLAARLLAKTLGTLFNTSLVSHLVATGFLSKKQTWRLLRANRMSPLDFTGVSILPLFLITKITNRFVLKAITSVDRIVGHDSVASVFARSLMFTARKD